jgi:ribosomal protein L34E
MTDNTVDLDAKRKAKAPKCEICGKPVHEGIGECRRVESIEYELADGTIVRYHLWPLGDEDEDVAG